MMTAANLGARITGWGFVVFTVGSIAWSIVGLASGQTNLLATNAFLTIVNLVGIWRWLGRQRKYEDGARAAERRSRSTGAPSLFAAAGIAGMPISDICGREVGKAVDAMIACGTGCVDYVVIASGGIGGIDEELRAIPADQIDFHADGLVLQMSAAEFLAQGTLAAGDWPGRISPGRGAGAPDPVGPVGLGRQPRLV